MNTNLKLLTFSSILAIISLGIPFSMENVIWVKDAGYSFLIQVALPHLGIAVSSVISGYAGGLYLNSIKDQTLDELALLFGAIATGMLISGFYFITPEYVFTYSLVCPPLIGIAMLKLSEYLPLQRRGVALTLIGLLIIPSFALICIGITSLDWVMIVDFGTGLRVLLGAMIGGLAATMKLKETEK